MSTSYFVATLKYGHDHAETVIAVVAAIVVDEIEHAGIGRTAAIATTIQERIARVREVRVI